MNAAPYSKTEIDLMMHPIHQKLDLILAQTEKHNHRLSKLERIVWVVGTASFVILIMKGSELVNLIKLVV